MFSSADSGGERGGSRRSFGRQGAILTGGSRLDARACSLAAWLLSSAGALGCAEPETSPDPVSFAEQVQPVFNEQCLCHMESPSGTKVAPFLTLNEGQSLGELVGVASMEAPALARVEPGIPEESYLWHKIRGTHLDVGGSGESMPPTGPLEETTIQLIEDWIAQGAEP